MCGNVGGANAPSLPHFDRLQSNPGKFIDYQEQDEIGQPLQVSIFDGWAIYFWMDEADQHLKILRLVKRIEF